MNRPRKLQTIAQKLSRICIWTVFVVFGLSLAWILFLRINAGLELESTIAILIFFLAVVSIIGLLIIYRKNNLQWLTNQKFLLICMAICFILGIILRLIFLRFSDFYLPYGSGSDTGIHWYTAQEILETGQIQSADAGNYEALFPYLTTYTLLVSLCMRIFGVTYAAILIPNLIFDLIAAILLYILLKQWKNQKVAAIGAIIMILNPLSIAFCVEGMALSVTNLFIMLAIFAVFYLWRFYQQQRYAEFLLLAALTGLTLSLGNAFRAVFTVIFIALAILIITELLHHPSKSHFWYLGTGLLMIMVTFSGSNAIIDRIYHQTNPYYTENHGTLGWSFFVGANYQNNGRWSDEDWAIMSSRLYGDDDTRWSPTEINQTFMQEGIQRYLDLGIKRTAIHFLSKSRVLFSRNNITTIRNFEEQFTNVDGSEWWYWFIYKATLLTITFFAVMSFVFVVRIFKDRKTSQNNSFLYFLALCFCGLLASSLLVEVMSRYISIFIVPFVIFSTLGLYHLLNKIDSSHSVTNQKLSEHSISSTTTN